MVIVGFISNGNLFLIIGKSGKVYCDSGKIGDSAWEAWNTLCNLQDSRIVAWQHL